jgi:hypothetical protein
VTAAQTEDPPPRPPSGERARPPSTAPVGVDIGSRPSGLRRIRNYSQKWLLRRRRKRAARKRGSRRRSTYALSFSLLVLFGAYAFAQSYVVRKELPGRELSVDQLSALADERRIDTARFLDQDAVVAGTYRATGLPVPGVTEPEQDQEQGGDEGRPGDPADDDDAAGRAVVRHRPAPLIAASASPSLSIASSSCGRCSSVA